MQFGDMYGGYTDTHETPKTPETPEAQGTQSVSELQDTQEAQQHSPETQNNGSSFDSFLRRQEVAEWTINNWVDYFVNHLGSNLTNLLVSTYDDMMQKKLGRDPKYLWLSESGIWLKALEKVQLEHIDEISWSINEFMTKFIYLLNELSKNKQLIDNLWPLLRQRALILETFKESQNIMNNTVK